MLHEDDLASASGGVGPVWSRDGRTLFYESAQSGERLLMSVPVSVDGGTLKLGTPSRVVSLALAGGDEYGRSAIISVHEARDSGTPEIAC